MAGDPAFEQMLVELAALLQQAQPQQAPQAPAAPRGRPDIEQRTFAANVKNPLREAELPPEMQPVPASDPAALDKGNAFGKQLSFNELNNNPTTMQIMRDALLSGQKRARDARAGIGDMTPVTPVANALLDPSGANTVTAGLSMLPVVSKLPAKATMAGLGTLMAGGLMQADAADQKNNASPGIIAEIADRLGFKTGDDREQFRQKWEQKTPAPQNPGTKEEYMARARAEFENSPAYKARVEKGQLKVAQQELATYLDKIAKSGEYEKTVAGYDTKIKGRDEEFNKAYTADLAERERLKAENWQKPFNQRHPETAATIMAGSFALPAWFGWRNAKQSASSRNELLNSINSARTEGNINALDRSRLALQKFEEAAPKNELLSLAKSAAVPFEMRFGQNAYDYGLAPQDSGAKKAAVAAYDPTNPTTYSKAGLDVLGGGVSWLGGNQLAKYLGKDPNLNKARSAAELAPEPPPLPPMPQPKAPATPPPVPLRSRTPEEIDAAVEKALDGMKDARGSINWGGYKNHDELRAVIRRLIESGAQLQ